LHAKIQIIVHEKNSDLNYSLIDFQWGIQRLGEISVEIEQHAVIREKDLKGFALDK